MRKCLIRGGASCPPYWLAKRPLVNMVVSCCVVGCSNRAKKGSNKSFYRVPKIILNQGEEIEAITRKS